MMQKPCRLAHFCLLTLLTLLWNGTAAAQQPAAGELAVQKSAAEKRTPTQFLRVLRNDEGDPSELQTSIVSYTPASGKGELVVDLVGAVHVGDLGYYRALNKRFEDYDVVLYELVAPKGTIIPQGGKRSDNPLAFLQNMTKSLLELESQTDHIDYTKDNFVHADMSPDEMAAAMRKRGDDGLTLALSITADLLRQANLQEQRRKEKGEAQHDAADDPLMLLFDPGRSTKLKRQMAEQFADPEALDAGLGQTLQRMLIKDRNEAAMKVFQKELAQGRKRIAIFYGAAHMPDFEQRLMVDFGLRPAKTRWVTAWDLRPGNMGETAKPVDLLRRLLEGAGR